MRVVDWGEVEYQEAARRQLDCVQALIETRDGRGSRNEVTESSEVERPRDVDADTLVFCTHPPVVTLGRGTKPGDVFGWHGPVVETSRGGRVTYHGPSQIVVYPILDLHVARSAFAARDLHGYLRALEQAIVNTLREFQIQAEARTVKPQDGGPSLTGVWVGERKIASIGIAIKKWVTYHGLALNVSHDPAAFTGINPCGFSSSIMTSMEQELRATVDRRSVHQCLEAELSRACQRL